MTQPRPTEASHTPSDDPEAPSEARPGVLRGGAVLTLQTRQAQRLVKGRGYSADKPAIIGLIGFANLVRSVWHGARADDPYADWWLLKVHGALAQADPALARMAQTVADRFDALDALQVVPPASTRPVRVSLNFSNPYAFQAAHLVGTFDALACQVLSARHVGLLVRDEAEALLHQGGRVVRRVLQSPVGYRFFGITRRDLAQGTTKAQQARESMGEVPDDVLTGGQRAPHAPAMVSPSHEHAVTDPTHLAARPSAG